jgi:archaellum component FlaC
MTEDPLSREAVTLIGDDLREIKHTQRLHGLAIARLDEKIDGLSGRMDRIDERMGRFDERMDRFEGSMNRLESKLDRILTHLEKTT